ncbi:MAG: RNA polymerase sigma factor [Terriglobales bacterium]
MNLHITVQVSRSPDLNQMLDRLQHKLDSLLLVFQPELVQLQGRLVRHTSREGVCCRLNLHLPTGQMSSETTAAAPAAALRAAAEDLVRQLHRHKQRLRETRPRFRPGRAWMPPRPAPVTGEQRQADLAAYFGGHYDHLLAFVRRQIALREQLGELPRGWLEPAEVLNEVVVAALDARPAEMQLHRGRWLLVLCATAIRTLTKDYGERRHGLQLRSLEDAEAGPEMEGDELEEQHRLEDRLRSAEADPEENAAAVEAMRRLISALARLPLLQRHDLVLYLLEGFRPHELAQLSHRSEIDVRASLEQAEAELRRMPDWPTLLRRQLPLPPPARRRGSTQVVPQRA